MEEISITDEEYAEHLNHRIIIGDLVTRPVDELKERLAEMATASRYTLLMIVQIITHI